jgi:hypothetical protein
MLLLPSGGSGEVDSSVEKLRTSVCLIWSVRFGAFEKPQNDDFGD